MNEARSTITINELNMARRQCLRLITVDETTVSSSRSSSSSRFLLLHRSTHLHRFGCTALPASPPSLFCQSTRTCCITLLPRTMSLIFSSLPSCVFLFFLFFRILLISFYFVLRSVSFFSPGAASSLLLPPSVSPFSSPHSTPDPSSSDSLPHRGPFLLLSRTGNTRVRRPPRVSTQRSAS